MSTSPLNIILTNAGKGEILTADQQGLQLQITHISAGSSGYSPSRSATALVAEQERVEIASSQKDLVKFRLDVNAVLDSDKQYWVREVGFWAADTLIYLWSSPESELTLGYKSAAARFLLGMSLTITDSPLDAIQIVDQGQPLDLSLVRLENTLKGSHGVGELYEFDLGNQVEAQHLLESDHTEYMAEILRGNGQSGVFNVRQYKRSGAYPWHRPTTVNYAALGIHSHWDTERICGMAEISAIVNGYYIRTRHNDYLLRQPRPEGHKFLAVEDIDTPNVPADVSGTPEDQIAKMQGYFKVLVGEAEQNTVDHFDTAFEWALSYMEVWLEVFDPAASDTFDNPRHQLDASSVGELVDKLVYFNASGHKNRLENLTFNHNVIRIVGKDGVPKLATLKYRICVQPVGSVADYPLADIVQTHEDLPSRLANYLDHSHVNSRAQRFSIKQKLGTYDATNRRSEVLIDELMSKIPGLNGAGAELEESFDQYGAVDYTVEYNTENPLNAAYYNRFYTITNNDASGRRNLKRGWNDPTLWVSKNTREEVLPLEIDADDPVRYSYAIPLELILLTPLTKFNPHNVPYLADANAAAYNPKANLVAGRSSENPMPGYNKGQLLFYHTPANFYSSGDIDGDPADTALQSLYMQCADNTPRRHTPSGTEPILPLIEGMEQRVRLRYPVHFGYHEGSPAAAELSAYKQVNAERQVGLLDEIVQLKDRINTMEKKHVK